MIHVNLLGDPAIKALRLKEAIAAAREALRTRSFSGRNPALGKMINCGICYRRHRQVQVMKSDSRQGGEHTYTCIQVFHKGRVGSMTEGVELIAAQNTLKGIMGARSVAKKRFHPHPSKRKLQLVERTQKLYFENEPYFTDAKSCMEESRDMAARELKGERRRTRRSLRKIQDVSRRINAGLARGGSRPLNPEFRVIKPTTKMTRNKKLEERTSHNESLGEVINGSL